MTNMIEIPIDKVGYLFKEVYNNSVPIGLGIIHHIPGTLPDTEYDHLMQRFDEKYNDKKPNYWEGYAHLMTLDYVLGRCCKMYLFRDKEGRLFIKDQWLDHDHLQLQALIDSLGIEYEVPESDNVRLVG